MSYRWNAHETVASGAVSDSEATRPLQTGDNAPTLPFSAEAVADRAAEFSDTQPISATQPILATRSSSARAYAHDAQDPTEVLPARSPDTRLLSNAEGSTRLMQATQTLEEPTIQASRSPYAAPRVEPATPAAPAAPVPLVLVDRPPDSVPAPPLLSEPPPQPARKSAATAAATIEVDVVNLISMFCTTSQSVKRIARRC